MELSFEQTKSGVEYWSTLGGVRLITSYNLIAAGTEVAQVSQWALPHHHVKTHWTLTITSDPFTQFKGETRKSVVAEFERWARGKHLCVGGCGLFMEPSVSHLCDACRERINARKQEDAIYDAVAQQGDAALAQVFSANVLVRVDEAGYTYRSAAGSVVVTHQTPLTQPLLALPEEAESQHCCQCGMGAANLYDGPLPGAHYIIPDGWHCARCYVVCRGAQAVADWFANVGRCEMCGRERPRIRFWDGSSLCRTCTDDVCGLPSGKYGPGFAVWFAIDSATEPFIANLSPDLATAAEYARNVIAWNKGGVAWVRDLNTTGHVLGDVVWESEGGVAEASNVARDGQPFGFFGGRPYQQEVYSGTGDDLTDDEPEPADDGPDPVELDDHWGVSEDTAEGLYNDLRQAQAEALGEQMAAQYDDDPNPYHGTYSEE